MANLGTRSDGTPYTRRLSTRTRRVRAYKEDVVEFHLGVLDKAPNLEVLEIADNPVRSLDLTPLARCPKLAELTLGADTPIDLTPLAACPTLTTLGIHARKGAELDLSPLAGHPSLASLRIVGDRLTELNLAPLAACETLRRLSLETPALRRLDLDALADLTGITNLYIQSRRLDRLDLALCRGWPELATLQVMQAPLQELDLAPLQGTQLARLHLAGHTLRRLDLSPLAGLETFTGLVLSPMPQLILDAACIKRRRAGQEAVVTSPAVQDYLDHGLITIRQRTAPLAETLRSLARQRAAGQDREPGPEGPAAMDEAAFWRLIEEARRDAQAAQVDITEAIARRLVRHDPKAVAAFRRIFWTQMGRVGGEAHQILFDLWGGCSDDVFLDVRQWLIARGRDAFRRVADDPAALREVAPEAVGHDESIISLAITAVEEAQALAAAEREMAAWLAHPMEYGVQPVEVTVVHREVTRWPLRDEPVELVLHRYRMPSGASGIGMTGPITWSFIDADLHALDVNTLKQLYAGWYVAFTAVNAPTYDAEANRRERDAMAAQLKAATPGFVRMRDYLHIGELIFYAYEVKKPDGATAVVARGAEHRCAYPADAAYLRVPPLYVYIGSLFFAGKL